MNKPFSKNYVTTPIYYVNDKPHIGHAYSTIAADIIARYKRLKEEVVYFVTGTDEHGQKVQKTAQANHMDTQNFVDNLSASFKGLVNENGILNVTNNDFIRTTETRHKEFAQFMWTQIQHDIYKDKYSGWYSIKDEAFYSEDEYKKGLAPKDVVWMEEESYFFALSKYAKPLLEFYKKTPRFIVPQSRYNEVIRFIREGLTDLSISRSTFSWGVKVPNDESHVMYVWLDALTNYLSVLSSPNKDLLEEYWNNADNIVHVIGKDILRFHAIYWPAFLMSANMKLPHQVVAHGWWTRDGQKMSKSIGNVIDPVKVIKEYGCDYLRYFLFSEVPFGQDGDFRQESFAQRVNAELANNIGNLMQRALKLLETNFDLQISKSCKNTLYSNKILNSYIEYMDDYKFDKALSKIIQFGHSLNQYFDLQQPWVMAKDETQKDQLYQVLYNILDNIRILAILLYPFIPESIEKIFKTLNISLDKIQLNFISQTLYDSMYLNQIESYDPIFPRIQR